MLLWLLLTACTTPPKGGESSTDSVPMDSWSEDFAITIQEPSDGASLNEGETALRVKVETSQIRVRVSCGDGDTLIYEDDDFDPYYESTTTISLTAGTHSLSCRACDERVCTEDSVQVTVLEADADQDGYNDSIDCDDDRADIHPDAAEHCDGVDEDCDALVDDDPTDPKVWYQDNDGDGFGSSVTTTGCGSPTPGWAAGATDCDDANFLANPDQTEVCDSFDNDCDGNIDNTTGVTNWFADADGDGFGDPSTFTADCMTPVGYTSDNSDCDDTNPDIHPAVYEHCDGVDENCDGAIDDGAIDPSTWYLDNDGDGQGGAITTLSCLAPANYLAIPGDCNDANPDIYLGAVEYCNQLDDDCDGTIDEDDAADAALWYLDSDTDRYGDANAAIQSCDAPSGYVASDQDCDDQDALVGPPDQLYYTDADADSFGTLPAIGSVCTGTAIPGGYSSISTDCNDASASIHLGAKESCDGVDENCDGLIDNNVATAPIWYMDLDGDGYTSSSTIQSCNQPASGSATASSSADCNDASASVYPGAKELCNQIDDDCDGVVDDNATNRATWYYDADGDGYGVSTKTQLACDQPKNYASTSTDCNDADKAIHPGASEICNSKVDDDCDGLADDADGSVSGQPTWYEDSDGDTYGNSAVKSTACTAPGSYVSNSLDCDDTDKNLNPTTQWYLDYDGDTYGLSSSTKTQCVQPASYVRTSGDCDDNVKTVNPKATETCNSIDDDCDALIDDADSPVTGTTTWYIDSDKDTQGTTTKTKAACSQPTGYVSNSDDCDDKTATTYKGAKESCDGVDNDCDLSTDEDWSDAGAWALGSASTWVSNGSTFEAIIDPSSTTSTASVFPNYIYLCPIGEVNKVTWSSTDYPKNNFINVSINGLVIGGNYTISLSSPTTTPYKVQQTAISSSLKISGGSSAKGGEISWELSITPNDATARVCGSSYISITVDVTP